MSREIDKTGWPEGPWMTEPDELFWTDEETGLLCSILRNNGGALCGYVGVPAVHPCYGDHYDSLMQLDTHGGLTFSGTFKDQPDYWMFGFDCAHAGDYAPVYERLGGVLGGGRESYRHLAYVQDTVTHLAKQLYSLFAPESLLAREGMKGIEQSDKESKT